MDVEARCGITRILDRLDHEGIWKIRPRCDMRAIGREVHMGRIEARHLLQHTLDAGGAGGAGHPLHHEDAGLGNGQGGRGVHAVSI